MRNSAAKLPPRRLKLLLILLFTTSTFYLLNRHHILLNLHCPSPPTTTSDLFLHTSLSSTPPPATTLRHLFFSVASSASSFSRRLPFLSLWYSPNTTRALLFLDKPPLSPPPLPFFVSSDTSRFPYSFPRGHRSAVRVARIVKEVFDRGESDVRWFVFGDDDTVFVPENLVGVLSKYDHEKWYYIGSNSESSEQNLRMTFGMAYGGGGFAISSPLARVLSRVLDSCLMRYPHLYGSDHRISSCIYELGIELTREPGFHQLDVRGDLFGLLTAHPLSPLISLHHLEIVEPIFPRKNQTEAVQHLFKAVRADPSRILQQTVCYDHSSNLTVSVAWGYAVQVFEGHLLLPDILAAQRSFTPWRRRGINIPSQYVFDTRDYPQDPCKRPVVFFLEDVASGTGRVWSKYRRNNSHSCSKPDAIENLKDVKVFSKKLQHNAGLAMAPRRDCCDIIHPFKKSMVIDIRHCGVNELIAMNP
ncbi:uncharacterized protein LOC110711859 [Chenopodium quinoa]|uniref:uncharacterized protein LOC110711859 n=1 Tax=Chenopodium quinoa TaxID=63459 RepID=UPI000B79495B|nr:uncharacterized protein LOC110711859 [Chenopodium quinoa]